MNGGWIRADWPAPGNVIAGTIIRGGDIAALPLPGARCWLDQVHGADVIPANEYDPAPQADASVAHEPGIVCLVKTADCLPVLFCAADGSEIAAAHAGWRGLVRGILDNTVAAMQTAPGSLLAWMGPAISQPNFEVGDDVRDAFLATDPGCGACFEVNARGRWQADLFGLARRRLAAAGLGQVYGGGLCTFADPERFFSWRRDGSTGRLISFVALK